MAPPSSKPYTSLSSPNDDEDDELEMPSNRYLDNPDDDEEAGEIAEQSPELQAASANNRGRSCRRYTFAVLGLFALASVLLGGKYYYDQGGEVPGFVSEFLGAHGYDRGGNDFTEENVGVRGSPNEDTDIAQELFEGANENGDGMMVSASEMMDDEMIAKMQPEEYGEEEMDDGIEKALEFEEEEIEEIEAIEEREPEIEEGELGGDAQSEVDEAVNGEQGIGGDEQSEVDETAEQSEVLEENEAIDEQPSVSEETMETLAEEEDVAVVEEALTISTAYIVVEQVTHDPSSFTQGLSYGKDGTIYETTGLYGNSKLRKINPESFEVEQSVDIDRQFFGEGSTFFTDSEGNSRIIEITWKEQTLFIYDAETFEQLSTFPYTTTAPNNEGWGITYDESNQEFIVSDGSSYLYFWDRDTFQEKRKVEVRRFDGRTQNMLNELEFMDGLVCCNIWHSDDIICVDPATGKSVREYDMSSLWPRNERGSSENVLNGIALGKDHVLITGKRWDRMYKISFADWPSLYRSTDEENTEFVGESSEVIQSEVQEDNAIVEVSEEGDESVEADVEEGEVIDGNNEEEGSDENFESVTAVEEESINEDAENTDTIIEEQLTISTSYTVVEQVTHDPTSFTQGLSYGKDGTIYETTGLYGNSKLRKINPESFEVEQSVDVDEQYFGEGSTFFIDAEGNSRIIEITWQEQTAFIYDAETLERLSTFQYTTTAPNHEGWGITYDESNQEFIVSDGSSYLYFWDRDTYQEKRKVEVTRFSGAAQTMLNELELMDGLVCCNIWHSDDIICVDPTSGNSVREYDMSSLYPRSERGGTENVLNGIALGADHVLITGKQWDRMFKISFADWPSLFANAAAANTASVVELDGDTTLDESDPDQSGDQEKSETTDEVTDENGESIDTEAGEVAVVSEEGVDSIEVEEGEAISNIDVEPFDEEELPDYFVPLTPEEKEDLKNRLRDTLYTTVSSLLLSASPSSDKTDMLPQRTFVIDPDVSKQFMHMHHMKTGGTSMDGLIHCALQRQRQLHDNTFIQYSSMSECGSGVRRCMDELATGLNATVINNVFYENDVDGNPNVDAPFDPAIGEFESTVGDLNVCQTSDCGVMSYCASLHTVRTFGWKDVDKITVIRNPVDRAWSMYRFTLQSCYQCKELKDVLMEVANGTFVGRGRSDSEEGTPNFVYDPSNSCAVQMIGHQATNLLSSIDLYNVANDVTFPREQEIVEEAVKNLRESFTWIGLTDRLVESVEGFRTIFPFLAENLNDAVSALSEGAEVEDPTFSLPAGYIDSEGCPFQHQNEGRDPTCGTKEMDDETVELILKLNNRDMAVYKAAVERFELQMEVIEEYKAGNV